MNSIAKSVVVIGGGGFGREVLDVLRDQHRAIHGVVDDEPTDRKLELLGAQRVPFLGSVRQLLNSNPGEVEYLLGIGDGPIRRTLDAQLTRAGFEAATVVHSSASFGFDVLVGPGTVVCAGARLTTNIRLGRHVHVNLNATVGHDARLGSYVTLNPGAAVSGGVTIGEAALVGAKAFILQGVSVGEDSIVGAAAAAMKNVGARTTVAGVPARLLKNHE